MRSGKLCSRSGWANGAVVAETGAGQHGVATATVCALLGLDCVIYMGTEDMRRQSLNVFRMRLLGAEVRGVDSGSRTLKDAINEAMRDWVANVAGYPLPARLGPRPASVSHDGARFPIGDRARSTRTDSCEMEGRLPDLLIACVGGGSNAIGLFYPFIEDEGVAMVGVEAGGEGIEGGRHAARFGDPSVGRLGVLQGTETYVLQDEDGQIALTHSISAGLDYAAVGPEHAYLRESGRASYTFATDDEALEGLRLLAQQRGDHSRTGIRSRLRELQKRAPEMGPEQTVLVNMSGRGDKDMKTVIETLSARDDATRHAAHRSHSHFIRHLRLPFNLLLSPIYLWGVLLAGGTLWDPSFWLGYVTLHLFLYGGGTAFNSFYDRDEGPIGGMAHPPPVDRGPALVLVARAGAGAAPRLTGGALLYPGVGDHLCAHGCLLPPGDSPQSHSGGGAGGCRFRAGGGRLCGGVAGGSPLPAF